jgi:hypothetical protein
MASKEISLTERAASMSRACEGSAERIRGHVEVLQDLHVHLTGPQLALLTMIERGLLDEARTLGG